MDNISWNAESSEYQLRSSTETPFHTMQGLHRPKQQINKPKRLLDAIDYCYFDLREDFKK